jgi:hypothetical protein
MPASHCQWRSINFSKARRNGVLTVTNPSDVLYKPVTVRPLKNKAPSTSLETFEWLHYRLVTTLN